MKAHYHAMAGMCGYMPNVNEIYDKYEDAVESMASLHELSIRETRELREDGYISLNLYKHGNEYAEVVKCNDDEHLEE